MNSRSVSSGNWANAAKQSHARMSRLEPRARVQRWGPCEGSHLSVCIFRLRGLRSFLHPQPKLHPPPPPHTTAAEANRSPLRPSSRKYRGTPESLGSRREGEAGREEAGGGKVKLGREGGCCSDEHRSGERPYHHVLVLEQRGPSPYLPVPALQGGSNLIRTSIYDKYSGSVKITTQLDHIGHCKTAYATNWSKRWNYRVFIRNTRRD